MEGEHGLSCLFQSLDFTETKPCTFVHCAPPTPTASLGWAASPGWAVCEGRSVQWPGPPPLPASHSFRPAGLGTRWPGAVLGAAKPFAAAPASPARPGSLLATLLPGPGGARAGVRGTGSVWPRRGNGVLPPPPAQMEVGPQGQALGRRGLPLALRPVHGQSALQHEHGSKREK